MNPVKNQGNTYTINTKEIGIEVVYENCPSEIYIWIDDNYIPVSHSTMIKFLLNEGIFISAYSIRYLTPGTHKITVSAFSPNPLSGEVKRFSIFVNIQPKFDFNKDADLFVCPEGHMAIRKAKQARKTLVIIKL